MAGVATADLAPYTSALQELQARLQAVREIVVATKDKHQGKLAQALEKARVLLPPPDAKDVKVAPQEGEAPLRALMRTGDTGVHKMLRDAVQSAGAVLAHLEAVAAVRAQLEASIAARNKAGLEEVVARGTALGMAREVEAARTALRDMDRIRIKCHLGTDIRILSLPRDMRFAELRTKVEQTYGAGAAAFVMKYKDDVGDMITLATQEDLATALALIDAATQDGNGPKLSVYLSTPALNPRASIEGTGLLHFPLLLHSYRTLTFIADFNIFFLVKERLKQKANPTTQLAASVQQLYELLAAERRTPPATPNGSPAQMRAQPPAAIPATPPTDIIYHYTHVHESPPKEREKNNKAAVVIPPRSAKSPPKVRRSRSRDSKDRLFVAGKSFAPT